jgi:hypothetical protein
MADCMTAGQSMGGSATSWLHHDSSTLLRPSQLQSEHAGTRTAGRCFCVRCRLAAVPVPVFVPLLVDVNSEPL